MASAALMEEQLPALGSGRPARLVSFRARQGSRTREASRPATNACRRCGWSESEARDSKKSRAHPTCVSWPRHKPTGQRRIGRIQVLKLKQRKETLRDTMDIDRVGPVMKIANRPVFPKKVIPVELKSDGGCVTQTRMCPGCGRSHAETSGCTRMEVVDPALVGQLAVLPGAVSSLPAGRIAGSLRARSDAVAHLPCGDRGD